MGIKILKKDSQFLGVLLGLLLPGLFFGLLFILDLIFSNLLKTEEILSIELIKLLSIFVNIIPIRYYFLKLKYELTGRGVLLVTFIYVVVYFWLIYN
ncbi:MAG: hypothetical protein K9G67_04920 [Bacteroidales bacterium]|nr:hypothetical protein [Bacteroidales bacterium]MCF8343468.1 hypothetical protein [Bacteroidales bacterium]MCF8352283.1 hypothetical protein [Bacteroidales bacterium]MCF8375674.1 hypothetical protein [Bacteroidales bacterium]MCF8401472.1 hypothetical protein [Bacteroidales bacterium]